VNKEKQKIDCYKCQYKGNNPGSSHIRCNHPSLEKVKDDPLLGMMAIFASVGRASPTVINSPELNIRGNPYGIKMGWFNFPFNFDPTWLENCDGFKPKEGME